MADQSGNGGGGMAAKEHKGAQKREKMGILNRETRKIREKDGVNRRERKERIGGGEFRAAKPGKTDSLAPARSASSRRGWRKQAVWHM